MKIAIRLHGLNRLTGLGSLAPVLVAVTMLWLTGCPAPPLPPPGPPTEVPPTLIRLEPSAYPNFSDDLDYEGLEQAIAQSSAYLQAIPATREFEFSRDRYSAGHILHSLQRFQSFIRMRPNGPDLQNYIRANFLVYQSVGRDRKGEVLFTGYYEPLLKGRRSISPEFRYPIYGRPDDLLTIDIGSFAEKYKGE